MRWGLPAGSRDFRSALSISRVLAGDERERYYLEQVGQGRDDYYAGEGEEGGVWLGTGAGSLGASGAVDEDGLTALLRGLTRSRAGSCGFRHTVGTRLRLRGNAPERRNPANAGLPRCRRRDSNPRHADYDSAALTD